MRIPYIIKDQGKGLISSITGKLTRLTSDFEFIKNYFKAYYADRKELNKKLAFTSISTSQTQNLVMIPFISKIEITSITGISNVSSFSEIQLFVGNTPTTYATIELLIQAVNNLSVAKSEMGFSIKFKVNVVAGQSLASSIIKYRIL